MAKKKRGRPKKRKKTLYAPAKYKKYGKIVSFKNPTQARNSVTKLRKEYRDAKTQKKKLRVYRVTIYAANRAKANLRRLRGKEYNEMKDIHAAYKGAKNSFKSQYRMKYGKKGVKCSEKKR